MKDTDFDKPQRIAKFLANCGLCSRRDAEKIILASRVKVDGQQLNSPAYLVDKNSKVEVDGKVISQEDKIRVWLYYKPAGLITTHKDTEGRPTVFDNIKGLPRVISVGRLDLNSEGLLILTNNGGFARKMELPQSNIERIYKVRAYDASGKILHIENRKVIIEGITYLPKLIEPLDKSKSLKNRWYKVILTEGKNREIRKIFNHYGFEVNRLIRISYGEYNLGTLTPGKYKEVQLS